MKLILKEAAAYSEMAGLYMPVHSTLDTDRTLEIPGVKAIRYQQDLKLVVEFKTNDAMLAAIELTGWLNTSLTALRAESDYKQHFFTNGDTMWMDHDIEEE